MRERRCHLVTVFGQAGIGKSRLSQEFARSVEGEAGVLTGRCLSYGKGITYWPVREIVAQAADGRSIRKLLEGSPDADVVTERLETAIGAGTGGAVKEEISWALRKLVELLARERPAAARVRGHPLGRADVARRDRAPRRLGTGRARAHGLSRPTGAARRAAGLGRWQAERGSVLLDPLSAEESSMLIAALPAAAPLAPEARARITAAAEGNPLFLEQTLAMLAQREDGVGEVAVPPAIQGLLAARLEQLAPEERRLLECASIEGETFHVGGVVALSPPESREAVTSHLMSLVRKELIRAESATLPGDDAFRFRHALDQGGRLHGASEAGAVRSARAPCGLARAHARRPRQRGRGVRSATTSSRRAASAPSSVPRDAKALELADQAGRRLGSAGRLALRRGDARGGRQPARARPLAALHRRAGLARSSPPTSAPPCSRPASSSAPSPSSATRSSAQGPSASGVRRAPRLAVTRHVATVQPTGPDRCRRGAPRSRGVARAAPRGRRRARAHPRAWRFLATLYPCSSAVSQREAGERALEHARRAGSRLDEAGVSPSSATHWSTGRRRPTRACAAARGCCTSCGSDPREAR